VQNWDKTITTIPTYALISNSFQNWRGMQESGGRRIARSLKIDQNTIRFLTDEELERLKKIHLLKDYIERKQNELQEYNEAENVDESVLVNGRRQTNIGVLRAYLFEYLKQHPKVNHEMLIQVRQMEPDQYGLPLQIYCFSREQTWVEYEMVQADIFDHIFAILDEFGLRLFQRPSGLDFKEQ
jgi:miniconductance mechanosensitive channel